MALPYLVVVNLVEARGINLTTEALPNPYAEVEVAGRIERTFVTQQSAACMWNAAFTFEDVRLTPDQYERATIKIRLRSANMMSADEVLGVYALQLATVHRQAEPTPFQVDGWVAVPHDAKPGAVCGTLRVTVTVLGPGDLLDDGAVARAGGASSAIVRSALNARRGLNLESEVEAEGAPEIAEIVIANADQLQPVGDVHVPVDAYTLKVVLFRAHELARLETATQDTGGCNPYVVVRFGTEAVASSVSASMRSPQWDEELLLPVYRTGHAETVRIELWHARSMSTNVLMATHTLSLNALAAESLKPHWVNLYGPFMDVRRLDAAFAGPGIGGAIASVLQSLLPFSSSPGIPRPADYLGRLLMSMELVKEADPRRGARPIRSSERDPPPVSTLLAIRVLEVQGVDPGMLGRVRVTVGYGHKFAVSPWVPAPAGIASLNYIPEQPLWARDVPLLPRVVRPSQAHLGAQAWDVSLNVMTYSPVSGVTHVALGRIPAASIMRTVRVRAPDGSIIGFDDSTSAAAAAAGSSGATVVPGSGGSVAGGAGAGAGAASVHGGSVAGGSQAAGGAGGPANLSLVGGDGEEDWFAPVPAFWVDLLPAYRPPYEALTPADAAAGDSASRAADRILPGGGEAEGAPGMRLLVQAALLQRDNVANREGGGGERAKGPGFAPDDDIFSSEGGPMPEATGADELTEEEKEKVKAAMKGASASGRDPILAGGAAARVLEQRASSGGTKPPPLTEEKIAAGGQVVPAVGIPMPPMPLPTTGTAAAAAERVRLGWSAEDGAAPEERARARAAAVAAAAAEARAARIEARLKGRLDGTHDAVDLDAGAGAGAAGDRDDDDVAAADGAGGGGSSDEDGSAVKSGPRFRRRLQQGLMEREVVIERKLFCAVYQARGLPVPPHVFLSRAYRSRARVRARGGGGFLGFNLFGGGGGSGGDGDEDKIDETRVADQTRVIDADRTLAVMQKDPAAGSASLLGYGPGGLPAPAPGAAAGANGSLPAPEHMSAALRSFLKIKTAAEEEEEEAQKLAAARSGKLLAITDSSGKSTADGKQAADGDAKADPAPDADKASALVPAPPGDGIALRDGAGAGRKDEHGQEEGDEEAAAYKAKQASLAGPGAANAKDKSKEKEKDKGKKGGAAAREPDTPEEAAAKDAKAAAVASLEPFLLDGLTVQLDTALTQTHRSPPCKLVGPSPLWYHACVLPLKTVFRPTRGQAVERRRELEAESRTHVISVDALAVARELDRMTAADGHTGAAGAAGAAGSGDGGSAPPGADGPVAISAPGGEPAGAGAGAIVPAGARAGAGARIGPPPQPEVELDPLAAATAARKKREAAVRAAAERERAAAAAAERERAAVLAAARSNAKARQLLDDTAVPPGFAVTLALDGAPIARVADTALTITSAPVWVPLVSTDMSASPAGELLVWFTYQDEVVTQFEAATDPEDIDKGVRPAPPNPSAEMASAAAAGGGGGSGSSPTVIPGRSFAVQLESHWECAKRHGVPKDVAVALARHAQPWLPVLRPVDLRAFLLGARDLQLPPRFSDVENVRDADSAKRGEAIWRVEIRLPDAADATLAAGQWKQHMQRSCAAMEEEQRRAAAAADAAAVAAGAATPGNLLNVLSPLQTSASSSSSSSSASSSARGAGTGIGPAGVDADGGKRVMSAEEEVAANAAAAAAASAAITDRKVRHLDERFWLRSGARGHVRYTPWVLAAPAHDEQRMHLNNPREWEDYEKGWSGDRSTGLIGGSGAGRRGSVADTGASAGGAGAGAGAGVRASAPDPQMETAARVCTYKRTESLPVTRGERVIVIEARGQPVLGSAQLGGINPARLFLSNPQLVAHGSSEDSGPVWLPVLPHLAPEATILLWRKTPLEAGGGASIIPSFTRYGWSGRGGWALVGASGLPLAALLRTLPLHMPLRLLKQVRAGKPLDFAAAAGVGGAGADDGATGSGGSAVSVDGSSAVSDPSVMQAKALQAVLDALAPDVTRTGAQATSPVHIEGLLPPLAPAVLAYRGGRIWESVEPSLEEAERIHALATAAPGSTVTISSSSSSGAGAAAAGKAKSGAASSSLPDSDAVNIATMMPTANAASVAPLPAHLDPKTAPTPTVDTASSTTAASAPGAGGGAGAGGAGAGAGAARSALGSPAPSGGPTTPGASAAAIAGARTAAPGGGGAGGGAGAGDGAAGAGAASTALVRSGKPDTGVEEGDGMTFEFRTGDDLGFDLAMLAPDARRFEDMNRRALDLSSAALPDDTLHATSDAVIAKAVELAIAEAEAAGMSIVPGPDGKDPKSELPRKRKKALAELIREKERQLHTSGWPIDRMREKVRRFECGAGLGKRTRFTLYDLASRADLAMLAARATAAAGGNHRLAAAAVAAGGSAARSRAFDSVFINSSETKAGQVLVYARKAGTWVFDSYSAPLETAPWMNSHPVSALHLRMPAWTSTGGALAGLFTGRLLVWMDEDLSPTLVHFDRLGNGAVVTQDVSTAVRGWTWTGTLLSALSFAPCLEDAYAVDAVEAARAIATSSGRLDGDGYPSGLGGDGYIYHPELPVVGDLSATRIGLPSGTHVVDPPGTLRHALETLEDAGYFIDPLVRRVLRALKLKAAASRKAAIDAVVPGRGRNPVDALRPQDPDDALSLISAPMIKPAGWWATRPGAGAGDGDGGSGGAGTSLVRTPRGTPLPPWLALSRMFEPCEGEGILAEVDREDAFTAGLLVDWNPAGQPDHRPYERVRVDLIIFEGAAITDPRGNPVPTFLRVRMLGSGVIDDEAGATYSTTDGSGEGQPNQSIMAAGEDDEDGGGSGAGAGGSSGPAAAHAAMEAMRRPQYGRRFTLDAFIPGRCQLVVEVWYKRGIGGASLLGSTRIDLEKRWTCPTWRRVADSSDALVPIETRAIYAPRDELPPGLPGAPGDGPGSDLAAGVRAPPEPDDDEAFIEASLDTLPERSTDVAELAARRLPRGRLRMWVGMSSPLTGIPRQPHEERAKRGKGAEWELRVVVWTIQQRERDSRVPIYATVDVLTTGSGGEDASLTAGDGTAPRANFWDFSYLFGGDGKKKKKKADEDAAGLAEKLARIDRFAANAFRTPTHPGRKGTGPNHRNLEINWRLKFKLPVAGAPAAAAGAGAGAGSGEGGAGAGAVVAAASTGVMAPRLRFRNWRETPWYMANRLLSEAVLDLQPLLDTASATGERQDVGIQMISLKPVGFFGTKGKIWAQISLVPQYVWKADPVGFGREEPNADPFINDPNVPDQRTCWERFYKWICKWLVKIAIVLLGLGVTAFLIVYFMK